MERLSSKRSLSHGTLFQVLFILHQGTSEQELALSGMTVSTVPVENGTVKFALSVHLADRPDGLSCNFTYQTDLFDLTTIQRLVAQFKTLLGSASAAPGASLHDVTQSLDRAQQTLKIVDRKVDAGYQAVKV
jgi:non-ribosomal peptide synthetase component F